MKKQFPILAVLVLFILSCDNEVLKAYQDINQTWYLQSADGMTNVKSEIRLVDMSQCKISRKVAKDEGGGCTAPINDFEKGGLSLSYSVKPNNIVEIKRVLDLPISASDGITRLEPSALEIALTDEMKGSWNYVIEGKLLTLKQGTKTLVFTL